MHNEYLRLYLYIVMTIRNKKDLTMKYICPFCKEEIKASKKTEVLYRNSWVKGCNDCFILSIEEATQSNFQSRIIQELL